MSALAAIWAAFRGLPRWVHAALAGALAFAAWLHFHDRAVVRDHEAGQAARTGERIIAADRAAIAADAARQARRDADSELTKEAIRHAEQDHPEAVLRPAGPAVRAAAGSLRARAGADRHAPR